MKIGIGIASWNRPYYLKKVLSALVKNDLSDTEFHLFQDGAICRFTGERLTDDNLVKENIDIFKKSSLPRRQIHWRQENVSVAINQFEAMRFLSRAYDYFIFTDDDVIVSPNYIALARKLFKQFEKDKKIACISPNFRLFCDNEQVDKSIDKLAIFGGHFWLEAFWSEKWKKIEKYYLMYYNIVKNFEYRHPHLYEDKVRLLYKKSGYPSETTSADKAKEWAIKMAGMIRLRLVVNRATGIGKYGFHSHPKDTVLESENKYNEDWDNKIYCSDKELNIKKFKIRED